MKPKNVLETKALKELNDSSDLIDEVKKNLNSPSNNTRLAASKIYNDNAGKRIKLAAVAHAIESQGQKIENYFD